MNNVNYYGRVEEFYHDFCDQVFWNCLPFSPSLESTDKIKEKEILSKFHKITNSRIFNPDYSDPNETKYKRIYSYREFVKVNSKFSSEFRENLAILRDRFDRKDIMNISYGFSVIDDLCAHWWAEEIYRLSLKTERQSQLRQMDISKNIRVIYNTSFTYDNGDEYIKEFGIFEDYVKKISQTIGKDMGSFLNEYVTKDFKLSDYEPAFGYLKNLGSIYRALNSNLSSPSEKKLRGALCSFYFLR